MRHRNGETIEAALVMLPKSHVDDSTSPIAAVHGRPTDPPSEGVDIKHQHTRDLCQNGRNTQSDNQIEFLALRHRLAITDNCQQGIALLLLNIIEIGVQSYAKYSRLQNIHSAFYVTILQKKGGPNKRNRLLI